MPYANILRFSRLESKKTTFIFNFSNFQYHRWICLDGRLSTLGIAVACSVGLAGLIAGCREQSSQPPSTAQTKEVASLSPSYPPKSSPSSVLRATLQKNFDLATQGASKADSRIAQMPSENSAGLACTPAQINHGAPIFRLDLPPRSIDRKGALAAISPDGSLHIIYISYGEDTDPEDLIIPSKSLDWESAKERGSFFVDARSFDALVGDAKVSKPLFRKEGIYQFALLNSDARDLLELGKMPFWVIAGCVVEWTP